MDQLKYIVFGIALFGGVFDLLTKRIPNWWTFPMMALGLTVQIYFAGWQGGLVSILGVFSALGLFLPVYLWGAMGAGDVKLLMSIGAWTDPQFSLRVAIAAIFIGGAYALVEVIYVGRFMVLVKNAYRLVISVFVRGLMLEPLDLDRNRKFSFGVSIALSVATVIWLEHRGTFL